MNTRLKILMHLSLFAACFAFLVIGLGAFTRLTNAGLGCPDWPGCYGQFTVPMTTKSAIKAQLKYPNQPLVKFKAWVEMVHRYFAGFLGLLVFAIAITATMVAVQQGFQFMVLGIGLFVLVIYQIVLGMWTVTLKLLPLVVSLHLLGGMLIFALLWLMYLMSKHNYRLKLSNHHHLMKLKPWMFLGLVLVFIQISLGAWTSTNYAALICPDFPYCNMHANWHYEFRQAFNLFAPLGVNYEGGVLMSAARMTIQMVHRFGALLISGYLLFLIGWINLQEKKVARVCKLSYLLLFVLAIQISLGISSVIFQLPLWVAVAHNLGAALLFIIMITLNYCVFSYRDFSKEVLV